MPLLYYNNLNVLCVLQSDRVASCLKKEDPDSKLWNHFQKCGVWSSLPLVEWYSCCFAGVLPDTSYERLVYKLYHPDSQLYNHFQKCGVWSSLPLVEWYSCCFAGVLPDTSYERLIIYRRLEIQPFLNKCYAFLACSKTPLRKGG